MPTTFVPVRSMWLSTSRALVFGEAFLDGSTRFGSQAVTPIELPLSFGWAGVGAGARTLLERGAISYCQRPSKAAQVWPSKIAHLAEVTSL